MTVPANPVPANPSVNRVVDDGRRWRIAGRCCALLGGVLWFVLQIVARDPFPPDISLSQYGLGATGWLFTVWVISVGISPLLLLASRPVPGPARWFLVVGFIGSLVTALVRTDEGGLQMSTHAKVHMAGSILASVFVPIGIMLVLRYAAQPWRGVAAGLALTTAAAGGMILLSAAGADTAGMGPAASWALWEAILSLVEMLLVGLYAMAVSTIDPPARLGRPSPVQSAIR